MRRIVDIVAHALLGLIFFVFGLNGFLNFIPMPELPESASKFMQALGETGYFFTVLKLVETVSGALLLVRRFVPLALVLLAPVTVQIVLFHLFLAPAGMVLPVVIVLLQGYLGFFVYRQSFREVLAPTSSS